MSRTSSAVTSFPEVGDMMDSGVIALVLREDPGPRNGSAVFTGLAEQLRYNHLCLLSLDLVQSISLHFGTVYSKYFHF